MEAKVPLDDIWFSLADEDVAPCVMEIPQLWNERRYTEIKVGEEAFVTPKKHGVYGGADISLDRFRLQVPRRAIVSRPGVRVPAAAIATRFYLFSCRRNTISFDSSTKRTSSLEEDQHLASSLGFAYQFAVVAGLFYSLAAKVKHLAAL